MEFSKLIGKKLKFYGVDGFCFKLGNHVFEALEDENDGYRSMMEDIVDITANPDTKDKIFFKKPIALVTVHDSSSGHNDGDDHYALIDAKDGHIWLTFGTDHHDDYYPCFRFYYRPKEAEDLSIAQE